MALKDIKPNLCNQNIPNLTDMDRQKIQKNVEKAFQKVLDALLIDTENDPNTKETAKRWAKMVVNETFAGRFFPEPKVTSFPNVGYADQILVVGPITVNSTCGHHFKDITAQAWVGCYPGEKVIGLSKYTRIIQWLASTPTIQEELTVMIADRLEAITEAKGLAVVIKGKHGCMASRGVKDPCANMVTSVMRGCFREDSVFKDEFLRLITNTKSYQE